MKPMFRRDKSSMLKMKKKMKTMSEDKLLVVFCLKDYLLMRRYELMIVSDVLVNFCFDFEMIVVCFKTLNHAI